MLKRTLVITMSFLLLVGLMVAPAVAKMKAPVVTLERVDISHNWVSQTGKPTWYLNTKEKTGSVMDLAFIIAILCLTISPLRWHLKALN
jgi:hypothetical protein